jgi:predicted peptidase
MPRGVALVLLFCAGVSCTVARSRPAPPPFAPASTPDFQLVDGPDGRYYAYVPPDAAARVASGERLPVILYLHGGDERGTDPREPTQVGLGPFVVAAHGAFPFVVLFPQCPRRVFWAAPAQLARLIRILDAALERLHGDPDRVYLTGNSMGGYGTWLLAAEHPDRFAAIVPICGGVKPPPMVPIPKDSHFGRLADPYTAVARAIGAVPTWAFNGADDWLVPPMQSKKIVAALRDMGNPARHTIYPGVGHPAWNNAYADPALFEWLAAQRRTR